MIQSNNTVKDRNGVDTQVGDGVYYLRGSMAGDGYYETFAVVEDIQVRKRMIRTDAGDHLHWHEFWQEQL